MFEVQVEPASTRANGKGRIDKIADTIRTGPEGVGEQADQAFCPAVALVHIQHQTALRDQHADVESPGRVNLNSTERREGTPTTLVSWVFSSQLEKMLESVFLIPIKQFFRETGLDFVEDYYTFHISSFWASLGPFASLYI
jgi:hypothetical protein